MSDRDAREPVAALPERMYAEFMQAAMSLTPGHIHQAESVAGVVATIWPTPTPGMWHVSTSRKQATEDPIPTDQVGALLDSWNLTAEYWTHGPGPLHEVNPAPEIWAAEASCLSLCWAVVDLIIAGARGLALTSFEHQQLAQIRVARVAPLEQEMTA